jgi:hypothetical protein
MKFLPVVGLIIGVGTAIYEFKQGNNKYGYLNLVQGISSLIPGVGTGLSIAMGVVIGGSKFYEKIEQMKQVTDQ